MLLLAQIRPYLRTKNSQEQEKDKSWTISPLLHSHTHSLVGFSGLTIWPVLGSMWFHVGKNFPLWTGPEPLALALTVQGSRNLSLGSEGEWAVLKSIFHLLKLFHVEEFSAPRLPTPAPLSQAVKGCPQFAWNFNPLLCCAQCVHMCGSCKLRL